MKSKRLIQIIAVLLMLLSTVSGIQPALAQTPQPITVVVHELTYWNATYTGSVTSLQYDKWPFTFAGAENFSVTVTATTDGLIPLILLLDSNGNEITRATGTLTSSQPAGSYALLIEPQAGSGNYNLTIRKVEAAQPSVSTSVDQANLNVGGSSTAKVALANVPSTGYSGVEFTCTYNPGLVGASNIAVTGLFGTDSAVAINGPKNGTFIIAIAGSNGNKATSSGTAFTFTLNGLQAGQTAVECKARVSTGDKTLTDIPSTAATLTVNAAATATPTSIPPTPTATPVPVINGTLTGRVVASKPVTVSLYNAGSSLVASVTANADGTFSLAAPAGTYTAVATASGFLSAQGSVTLTAGATNSLPAVTLPAGDIDGNNVIDQYDAMTIGMGYNTNVPAAADLNNDGVINVLDLELLAANYRKSGALAWK